VEKLKAAKPADASEGAGLKTKINELQQQLATIAEDKARLVTQHQNDLMGIKRDMRLEATLSKYKTVYDTLPGDVKKIAMTSLLNKNLQDSNAVLSIDDNGNFVLVGKDGTNVFGSDHRQLTPDAFFDKTFASILQNSDPKQITGKPAPVAAPNGQPAGNDFISSHVNQALADFENAGKAKMF
jgi:hypothetical protein